jgi:3-methylcrotonyl-CoA carboxylase alpha subunit
VQELGLEAVLLHSEADIKSRAYRLANDTVCIGPGAVSESYLSIEANIHGAKSANADAVHPGFGFLSENADFAEAVINNGLVFIGPSPEAIRLFGDKISAKKIAQRLSIPEIPGYQGSDQRTETLLDKMREIGFPLIVKAAAGGGGRGLKVVREMDQARAAIESSRREGLSSFGSDSVFLEKYLEKAKHIEVQIFGDASGKVHHFGERECSLQRRHQKVIEEAPASSLEEPLRGEILQAAIHLADEAQYRNAGTVEFLVQDERFYFMEMNTRLQVEHPVTELVWGVDLVKAQILTAQGQALPLPHHGPHGHSIECRLYAEDPYSGMPSTGPLGATEWPLGAGRRFEIGFESGDEVTSLYDPMIAKVIVWDETRHRAIRKMQKTLSETILFGLSTNIPYLQKLLSLPEFIDGRMTTRTIENHFPKGLPFEGLSRFEKSIARELEGRLVAENRMPMSSQQDGLDPWTFRWK